MKLTAHQCYVKSVEEKLTKEEYKQLLKDNEVLIGLRTTFNDMLKNKYTNVDVDKVISIFDEKYNSIKGDQLDLQNLPMSCDLNKSLIISVLDEYLKTNNQ